MNLVGIPWEEADCLALAVMAQKELWGEGHPSRHAHRVDG